MEPEDRLKQLPLKGLVPERKPSVINQGQPESSPEDVNPEDEKELKVLLEELDEKTNKDKKQEYDGYYSDYHIKKISRSKGMEESRVNTKEKIQIAKFVLGGQDPDTRPEILSFLDNQKSNNEPEIPLTEAERKVRDTENRASSWMGRRDIGGDGDE